METLSNIIEWFTNASYADIVPIAIFIGAVIAVICFIFRPTDSDY